ncbi:DUF2934 domain-containing protein [Inquilinus limosus]|uniref:DUF2934 domain-containing protein n=1 Tax=Inquilinus limosus TaxID=171674 RepID=UPI003F190E41
MDTSLEDRIRARAHEIWESEGRPSGRDREHWERALREVQAGETSESADIAPPEGTTGAGIASGLAPDGTTPGRGPAAGLGSIGTGGASTASTSSGSIGKRD